MGQGSGDLPLLYHQLPYIAGLNRVFQVDGSGRKCQRRCDAVIEEMYRGAFNATIEDGGLFAVLVAKPS